MKPLVSNQTVQNTDTDLQQNKLETSYVFTFSTESQYGMTKITQTGP